MNNQFAKIMKINMRKLTVKESTLASFTIDSGKILSEQLFPVLSVGFCLCTLLVSHVP